jgi:HJR/Mrr/RecB family endonuclease
LLVIYIAHLALLYFADTARFWRWLGYSTVAAIIIVTLVIAIVSTRRKSKEKRTAELLARTQETGLANQIKDFLIRFGMGQEKSSRAWEYRNYRIDWKRIDDLSKIMSEKGVAVSTPELSMLLRHYIDEREYRVTSESIKTDMNRFEDLDGTAFEILLVRLYEKMGYTVSHSGKPGDQGGDLIAMKGAERLLIQAKRYLNSSVGNDAVQQAFAAQTFYDCNKTAVVTTGQFTREALELARTNDVELISRERLQQMLLEHLKESWS